MLKLLRKNALEEAVAVETDVVVVEEIEMKKVGEKEVVLEAEAEEQEVKIVKLLEAEILAVLVENVQIVKALLVVQNHQNVEKDNIKKAA
jgi:hypothetical protein